MVLMFVLAVFALTLVLGGGGRRRVVMGWWLCLSLFPGSLMIEEEHVPKFSRVATFL